MAEYLLFSSAIVVILLVLNILVFSLTYINRSKVGSVLLAVFGIIPGFLGVLWGIVLFFQRAHSNEAMGILSVWLLLEVGAMQLRQVLKKLNSQKTADPAK